MSLQQRVESSLESSTWSPSRSARPYNDNDTLTTPLRQMPSPQDSARAASMHGAQGGGTVARYLGSADDENTMLDAHQLRRSRSPHSVSGRSLSPNRTHDRLVQISGGASRIAAVDATGAQEPHMPWYVRNSAPINSDGEGWRQKDAGTSDIWRTTELDKTDMHPSHASSPVRNSVSALRGSLLHMDQRTNGAVNSSPFRGEILADAEQDLRGSDSSAGACLHVRRLTQKLKMLVDSEMRKAEVCRMPECRALDTC